MLHIQTLDNIKIKVPNELASVSVVLQYIQTAFPNDNSKVVPVNADAKYVELLIDVLNKKVILNDLTVLELRKLAKVADALEVESILKQIIKAIGNIYKSITYSEQWKTLENDLENELGYEMMSQISVESVTDIYKLYTQCSKKDDFMKVCKTHKIQICKHIFDEIGLFNLRGVQRGDYCRIFKEILEDLQEKGQEIGSISKIREGIIELSKKHILKYIKWGIDPNTRNAAGLTLLHQACKTGNTVAVPLLIAAGANVNAKSSGPGFTPFELLMQFGRFEAKRAKSFLFILRELIRAGAKVPRHSLPFLYEYINDMWHFSNYKEIYEEFKNAGYDMTGVSLPWIPPVHRP